MYNESKVFLTMLAHITLHDFIAALILNSQSVYLALCLLSCHASQQMPPETFHFRSKTIVCCELQCSYSAYKVFCLYRNIII